MLGEKDDRLKLIEELKGFSDIHSVPEGIRKRKATNTIWLLLFVLVLCGLASLITYTTMYADIHRISHGYDECGNVCGRKNIPVENISCSGVDMEDKPYLLLDHDDIYISRHTVKCVSSCDAPFSLVMNTCLKDVRYYKYTSLPIYFQALGDGLYRAAAHMCYMLLVSVGVTVAFILLLRYATKYVVWGGLIGFIFVSAAISTLLWMYISKSQYDDSYDPNLQFNAKYYAVFFAVMPILALLITVALIKRIKLVVMIFEEAMKAMFDMPTIFLQPVLTFAAGMISIVSFLYLTLVMLSAGRLQLIYRSYDYVLDTIPIFTMVFNACFVVWMLEFIFGCQHMIVSGAVSAWYFCRDKSTLTAPIYQSWYNLIRYHLGTVALGSLIITIISILRAVLTQLTRYFKWVVQCICLPIEAILRYLTRNAYIQTAMHGTPFLESGKKAATLLLANVLNVSALNAVGSFVLFTVWSLIVSSAILTGALLYDHTNDFYPWAIYFAVLASALLGQVVFYHIQVAIETLLMCYCEDNIINDGVTTPFFMTTNLMMFVEQSKLVAPKVVGAKK